METKAITPLFTERGTIVCPASILNGKLHGIENLFEGCDSKLASAEMSGCGYDSQRDAINTMTENMRQLSLYAAIAHNQVSENLDKPLYEHFKKNATETITAIKLSEITTDNTFGLSEYVEIKRQGQHIRYKRAKANLTMEDFLGIQKVTAEDGTPILENVETVSEFASLFRKDYDTMTKKDMSLDEYLEGYVDSGDDSHKGYHPVADMISGVADIIILKPMIECITGKDLITGEYLTEEELNWKAAGICIDLITLGMGSKALASAKTFKEVLKIAGKTLTVDALSAAASYGTAYIGEELGLSEESIFILSMLAGGSVSYAGGKVLLNNIKSNVVYRESFDNWDDMKNAYKGTVTKFVEENKPLGATHPRDWLKKEGASLIIESLDNGTQIWKYTKNGITVPYVPKLINNELENVIEFPEKYMHPDKDIASFRIEGGFTGDRNTDRQLALEYLKSEGYDKVPTGYILHHDIDDGWFQLVRKDVHEMFSHYGGHYYNQ